MVFYLNFKPKEKKKRNQKSKDEACNMYKTKTCGKIMLTGSTVKNIHNGVKSFLKEYIFFNFMYIEVKYESGPKY